MHALLNKLEIQIYGIFKQNGRFFIGSGSAVKFNILLSL